MLKWYKEVKENMKPMNIDTDAVTDGKSFRDAIQGLQGFPGISKWREEPVRRMAAGSSTENKRSPIVRLFHVVQIWPQTNRFRSKFR